MPSRKPKHSQSLADLFPALSREWHPFLNGSLRPIDIAPSERKHIWWKCDVATDHVWEQSPRFRIQRNLGCPACNNRKVSVTNCLSLVDPEVSQEWDIERNGGLQPFQIVAFEKTKRYWICKKNSSHSFVASTATRVRKKTGCPYCLNRKVSKNNNLLTINAKLAAEWHYSNNWPYKPETVTAFEGKKRWWICKANTTHIWEASTAVRHRRKTGCPYCYAIRRADSGLRKHGSTSDRESKNSNFVSIEDKSPTCANQFDLKKNYPLKPGDISYASNRVIWWCCKAAIDHQWQASPASRTRGKGNCPFCIGNRLALSNSIAVTHPRYAEYFDELRNKNLTAYKIAQSSNKRIWWKCPANPNHKFQLSPNSFLKRKHLCLECAHQSGRVRNLRQSPELIRSLSSNYPDIARELHPSKNGELSADYIDVNSSKVFWWQCKESPEHVWRSSVANRTSKGNQGCLYCKKEAKSLKLLAPEVFDAINNDLNSSIDVQLISFGSTVQKLWVICPANNEHIFQSTANRLTTGFARSGVVPCSFCSGALVSPEKSLMTINPKKAERWDKDLNSDLVDKKTGSLLTPQTVKSHSHIKVWWRCKDGPDHVWSAPVKGKSGCPYCAGQRVSVTNSLATLFPKISREWHPILNNGLQPRHVLSKTSKRVWWQCPIISEHSYKSRVADRTLKNSGCPNCKLIPRSAIEIYLAFELSYLLNFDMNQHRLEVNDSKTLDIDILIPDLKIAIEYDGAYWHRNKQERDTKKSDLVRSVGWRSIRVREFPLPKTHQSDIEVPAASSVKEIADSIIFELFPSAHDRTTKIKKYLKSPTALCTEQAEKAIRKYLLEKKSRARKNEVKL